MSIINTGLKDLWQILKSVTKVVNGSSVHVSSVWGFFEMKFAFASEDVVRTTRQNSSFQATKK